MWVDDHSGRLCMESDWCCLNKEEMEKKGMIWTDDKESKSCSQQMEIDANEQCWSWRSGFCGDGGSGQKLLWFYRRWYVGIDAAVLEHISTAVAHSLGRTIRAQLCNICCFGAGDRRPLENMTEAGIKSKGRCRAWALRRYVTVSILSVSPPLVICVSLSHFSRGGNEKRAAKRERGRCERRRRDFAHYLKTPPWEQWGCECACMSTSEQRCVWKWRFGLIRGLFG